MQDTTQKDWHQSKLVPISIMIGMLIQSFAFVRYASQIESQVFANRDNILMVQAEAESIRTRSQTQEVALARIDQNSVYTREMVERILNSIERSNGSQR